ncbi:MAG: hypothetical protein AAGI23_04835 [Bacteroidota bacterium]
MPSEESEQVIGEAFERNMNGKDAVTESEIICAQLLEYLDDSLFLILHEDKF